MSIRAKILLAFLAPAAALLVLAVASASAPHVATVRLLGLGAVGLALLAMTVAPAVAQAIAGPIEAAARALIAAPADRPEVPQVDRSDELGSLLRAVQHFRDQVGSDAALLKYREEELRIQNQRFETALSNMSHGIAMFDGARRLIVSNPRYAEIYKLPPELVRPGTPQPDIMAYRVAAGTFAAADAAQQIQARVDSASSGEVRESIVELSDGRIVATTHRPMPDGGWVSTHQDITERRRAQAQIEHLARHDALTKLPNRAHFGERLSVETARIQRHGGGFALLCFDLDNFKAVNDTLGHPIGDILLRRVSDRVLACARETDMVARFGGDEFAVLQVAATRAEQAATLASRIIEAVSRPYEIEGHHVAIGASVGIATAPENGLDATELLKKADLALYRAKADGRGTYRFFEPEMDVLAKERRSLELALRNALARGELSLDYQPLVSVNAEEISGFEAMPRWSHPTRGVLFAPDFFPVAEEIGVLVGIGGWVLRQACADAASWPERMKVAVDVWPAQFKSGALVGQVLQALAASGLSASRLELEIKESVLLQDKAANLNILHQLRELGVRISMDDFGTGYSSLSYLRSFPFDKVKIDRSFVRDIAADERATTVLQALKGLGSSLSPATSADGVESRHQFEKLKAEGCAEVQGYYFGPPRSAADILKLVAADKSKIAAA